MASGYVYIQSEPALWTVGHYDSSGGWVPESDHESPGCAAERVHWLNGESWPGGKPDDLVMWGGCCGL